MAEDGGHATIIKKVKKGKGGGHHGGAWKVAYADFVTAMMAFFLLLWLLNALDEKKLKGIADYFTPTWTVFRDAGASHTMPMMAGTPDINVGQGGVSMPSFERSDLTPPPSPMDLQPDMAKRPAANPADEAPPEELPVNDPAEAMRRVLSGERLEAPKTMQTFEQAVQDAAQRMVEARDRARERDIAARGAAERRSFEDTADRLLKAISSDPSTRELSGNLTLRVTDDGLEINIMDREDEPVFPSDGAEPYPAARRLLALAATTVRASPNQIAVRAYLGGEPGTRPDAWSLTAERAIAAQKVLTDAGVPVARVEEVSGRGQSTMLVPDQRADPRNNRITVVLRRTVPVSS
ncbi:MAG: hypothetical protein CMO30_09195 [Tistrella sp.]|uniref:Chemotaxis protein MotB n=1 Tax=Tistrella mobilis TaxID=171437 RepID=A0A3B9IT13_9PROT|nr:flagellar motor protein MotB [Tistrella sp.]MAD37951.1 hypothetical protein [Tistrella sp.]MBA75442.1 hypothetical protein [Tistrella sp.]HAE50828.1 hypothetical protein [Tistrella mobilis]